MDYNDNRSFDEVVKSTQPDKRFESVVQDIIRDRDYNWSLNYYSDNTTSWDVDLAKTVESINDIENAIKINKAILANSKEKLVRNRLEPDDKMYLKLSAKAKEDINQSYAQAIDDLNLSTKQLEELKPLKNEQTWKQYVDKMGTCNLRTLRTKFRKDDDIEYLQRGVTVVMTNVYKLMGVELPTIKPMTCSW